MQTLLPTPWQGCYDDNWKGIITDESFAHPAKYAKGLIEKIYDHLLKQGLVKKGDLCVDPFGGIGTGGICAANVGLRWIGCELEPRFAEFAKQNFALHKRTWEQFGDPLPVIVQGDSRELRRVLGAVMADVCVSSPPYADQETCGNRRELEKYDAGEKRNRSYADAVISSPPYAESLQGDNTAKETAAESTAKRKTPGGSLGQSQRHAGYGSKENLGNLAAGSVDAVVSSPPFTSEAQGVPSGGRCAGKIKRSEQQEAGLGAALEGYGQTPGNLGNLAPGAVADAIVSSPPYEAAQTSDEHSKKQKASGYFAKSTNGKLTGTYAEVPMTEQGQLGNSTGETFWGAAKQIVQECYAILKPGGVAVWVVKAFVRNKALVDFPGDWRRLCDACGFETVEEVHASLVKETVTSDLFDGETTKKKERKSFFRRLAEKKGSPRIDHETVYFMRKPA